MGDEGDFYRNRGPGVVRLHRRSNAMTPNGVFCCTVTELERYCIGVYRSGNGKNYVDNIILCLFNCTTHGY